MKLLITGGAGFIGSHGADCCIDAGHDVAIGDNKQPTVYGNGEPLRKGEVRDIFTAGDLAAKVLGWSPRTGLREGLRQTLDFIRSQQEST